MTDRIEALERLQRLRESGALTEEEFQQEKAALLGRADAPDPIPPAAAVGEAAAADAASEIYAAPQRRGPPLWVQAGGAVLLLALILLAMLLLRRGGGEAQTFDVNSVAAANAAEAPVANVAAPEPPPGIRTRPQAEQLAAAFRAAFGDRTTRTVDEAEIAFRPGRLLWIGDRAVLVSNGANAEECHACAGMVAVHYLDPAGDSFRVRGEWLNVATDDYGRPPEWRITDELTGRPALRVENGGGNQGIFCSFVSYYDLAGARPAEIARVQTGYTNEGEEGGFELEGRIANIRPGRSFDVVYSGFESFTESYLFRGGRFQLEAEESRVPSC